MCSAHTCSATDGADVKGRIVFNGLSAVATPRPAQSFGNARPILVFACEMPEHTSMNLESSGTDWLQFTADGPVEVGNQNLATPFVLIVSGELAKKIDSDELVCTGFRRVGFCFIGRINNNAAKLRAALLDPDMNTSGRVRPNANDNLIRRTGLLSVRRIRCEHEHRTHYGHMFHSFSSIRQV